MKFDVGDIVVGTSKRVVKVISKKDISVFIGEIINEDEVDELIYAKGGVGTVHEFRIASYNLLKKGDVEFEF